MDSIWIINRHTGKKEREEVFGESAIRLLYGTSWFSKSFGRGVLHLFAKWPLFAAFYGWLQKRAASRRKIRPFITHFNIDSSEFAAPPESFASFNDFFIRKLKPECRPIAESPVVIPADGRYQFFPEIFSDTSFEIKKRPFCLKTVLQDEALAKRYEGGSCVIARLCPTDCHRFYFPLDCIPDASRKINGKLYSVNPIATKDNPWIWGANLRYLTLLSSEQFGKVAYMEVGATNVGSVIQTYTPGTLQKRGAEKGYFAFGGSALLLLFERGRIQFAPDLLALSAAGYEIRCLIGQSLTL